MKNKSTDIVTPFDWKRFTADASTKPARKTRARKPQTVRERIAKILGQRWGNPYCKPGVA